ncbi:hypothetical protein BN1708_017963, partial [Verticillium longisporum]
CRGGWNHLCRSDSLGWCPDQGTSF